MCTQKLISQAKHFHQDVNFSVHKYASKDLEVIETIFTVGNFFGLTPSSIDDQRTSFWQRIYCYGLFMAYTVGVSFSLYNRRNFYASLDSIEMFLLIVIDLDLYAHVWYCFMIIMRKKRVQWFRLVENLRKVESNSERSYFWFFVVMNLIFCSVIVCVSCAWIWHLGMKFFKMYTIEQIQMYLLYFYVIFANVFLQMMLVRYQYQSSILRKSIGLVTGKAGRQNLGEVFKSLKTVKYNLFILKQNADVFNEVFGWPVLFNIFYVVSKSLVYLSFFIKTNDATASVKVMLRTTARIYVMAIVWYIFLANCFLSDSILNKYEEIVSQFYQLEVFLTNQNLCEISDIHSFVNAAQDNHPEFTAARFFTIDKSTVFSVLNSLTTFLIVMIQFKQN